MSSELDRAALFVQRLLANKALEDLTPLQKEEQILQFLNVNAQALYPTLSSAQFFPGKRWQEVLAILTQALMQTTDATLAPLVEELAERLDLSFLAFLQERQVPADRCRREIRSFMRRLLGKQEARRAFAGPLGALVHGFADRYLSECFDDTQYVHFELTKVQRLRMSMEQVRHMIRGVLLLKPGIHLLTVTSASTQDLGSGVVQPQFADKALQHLAGQLPLVPQPLLRSAVNANVSCLDNPALEATSRFAAIMAARAVGYRPLARIDRGANTPDRSWFNIARRNFKYYGFDIKMLDEFYKIAAENGW